MGASQRNKGHNFERRIAKELRDIWPNSKRGYQSRNNMDLVPDVENPIFFIECKAHKKVNIKSALIQAEESRKPDDKRIALAITKDDNQPIIASMRYDDLFRILRLCGVDLEKKLFKNEESQGTSERVVV